VKGKWKKEKIKRADYRKTWKVAFDEDFSNNEKAGGEDNKEGGVQSCNFCPLRRGKYDGKGVEAAASSAMHK